MASRVEVLLATYNNASYIGELLESLHRQSYADYRLTVADDCSVDDTLDIVKDFEKRLAGRMAVHVNTSPSGSATANFSDLIARSDADYIMFADADDIWDRDKIGLTVAALERLEALTSPTTPLYTYSDVRVVDRSGGLLHASYREFKRMGMNAGSRLSQLLVCPPMLGCASGINRALVERACPVPVPEVTGHDWWCALVAKVSGRLEAMPEVTMSYRLHGANSSSQQAVSAVGYAAEPGKITRVRRGMDDRRRQARALADHFGTALLPNDRKVIDRFVATGGQGFARRRLTLALGGYVYPDHLRNLAMFAAC